MFSTTNKKVSIFLFLLGVIYLIASFRLPSFAYVPVDSDMIPIGLGILLVVLSVFLNFTKDEKQEGENPDRINKKDLPIVLGVIGMILLYILLLEIAGFILSTMLFLFFCSFVLGYKRHIVNGIMSVAFPILIYLLFNSFLQVKLPQGILPF
jgi:putative tricarboxylic transport membrane protein